MEKYINFLKKILEAGDVGSCALHTPEGNIFNFSGKEPGINCDIEIKDWNAIKMLYTRGDIGFGEAYSAGLWKSSDLANFLKYCCINFDNIKDKCNGNIINKILFYIYNNIVRINTKKGSKKNILEHYDISNNFFQLWLDPTMTYSAALRSSPDDTLEDAQRNKYTRIIKELELSGKSVLEIGCGWGGFAEEASKHSAEVTGITISEQQYQFAQERLGDKANILLQDYRDISSHYDAIVSIEMFEAIGEKYWPSYFNKIKSSLNKGGKAIIQTITIRDDLYKDYRVTSDYIRHCIFPGGMLPSIAILNREIDKAKLQLNQVFAFGEDYAWTLRQWLKNFHAVKKQLLAMNYQEDFLRSWEYYLCFSIAGFESKRIDVVQVEIAN